MFTGIISDVGTILKVESIPAGKRFVLLTQYDPGSIEIGASIACSGVCHTVIEKGENSRGRWFSIESARETLDLTTVSNWNSGDRINLERSLSMGDELGEDGGLLDVPDGAGGVDGTGADEVVELGVPVEGSQGGREVVILHGASRTFLRLSSRETSLLSSSLV
ncbi:MAG: hypothetical protein JKY49_03915 [Cohaesibacteraceae bacterium]|nr:hypothetical protein [Cohaesibacteraceae bacterium]